MVIFLLADDFFLFAPSLIQFVLALLLCLSSICSFSGVSAAIMHFPFIESLHAMGIVAITGELYMLLIKRRAMACHLHSFARHLKNTPAKRRSNTRFYINWCCCPNPSTRAKFRGIINVCPGLAIYQELIPWDLKVLNRPNNDLSNVCSLLDVCGGKVSNTYITIFFALLWKSAVEVLSGTTPIILFSSKGTLEISKLMAGLFYLH